MAEILRRLVCRVRGHDWVKGQPRRVGGYDAGLFGAFYAEGHDYECSRCAGEWWQQDAPGITLIDTETTEEGE